MGGYDGGFGARVGRTGLDITSYYRPWAHLGWAHLVQAMGPRAEGAPFLILLISQFGWISQGALMIFVAPATYRREI